MSKLSTLQITTLQEFRAVHPGATGIILEDDQGYLPLLSHLTRESIDDWDQLNHLKRQRVVGWFNGCGNGPPEPVNLRKAIQSYGWCFIFFQATFGREDIAAQMDGLLDELQQLDRLVLVNYHLDHSEAKDDLRRLFAMIPTVQLYFPDAHHIFEVDADEYINPQGASQVAKLFGHLRTVDLPFYAVSYRQFRRSVKAVGSQVHPEAAATAVRQQLKDATEIFFKLKAPWLPKQEFWSRVDRAFNAAFLS